MTVVGEYIEYIRKVRRYSERTCEIYEGVLRQYYDFVGSVEQGEFPIPTQSMIRSYEVYLMDKLEMNPRTVGLHLSVLGGYCRFLISKGELKSNPAHLVRRPKQEKRLPVFYREEAMRDYFRTHSGTMEYGDYDARLRYMIISILANTGIRRSELIGLNVGSVDFSRRVMRVLGKGDKMREIPLIPSLCDEISLYLSAVRSLKEGTEDPESPLLRTKGGERLYPVFVDRAVKRELGESGNFTGRKSPHALRHTLATELMGDGTDLNSIKELLGHSSLAATQVYTHNSIERLQNVYNNAHPRAKNGGKNGD